MNSWDVWRVAMFKRLLRGVILAVLVPLGLLVPVAWAANGAAADPTGVKWAFISAAIVAGAGVLGAAAAVAVIGAAALGALSEKPELAGRALIFLGLAEGIAMYGLIIAIMILGKV